MQFIQTGVEKPVDAAIDCLSRTTGCAREEINQAMFLYPEDVPTNEEAKGVTTELGKISSEHSRRRLTDLLEKYPDKTSVFILAGEGHAEIFKPEAS